MATKRSRPAPGPGPETERQWKRYQELFPKYFWSEEKRLASIMIAGAKGSMVVDVDGKEYIDCTSQWGTNNLGNVNPEILRRTVEALEQYGFLIYFMNPHVPMLELAEKLLAIRPSDSLTRVFLELSGTGAAEGAVKYAVEASKRPLILGFMGQYHGLSIGANNIGAAYATERRYWEAFMGGVIHVPYPFPYHRPRAMSEEEYGGWIIDYIEDQVLQHVAAPDRIAGVIFEPVACEAGVWIPPVGFARRLKRLCHDHEWYFIADEVESGLGRTGRMWAIQHSGVEPDLVAIGKALSGGLMPIAAVLGSEEIMGEAEVAAGTTFGGHPAACVAAIATLEVMQRDHIAERSARLGAAALKRAKEWEDLDIVGEVRGLGLCMAVELVKDKTTKEMDEETARRVFFDCIAHGTIPLMSYGDNVLRIQPPLIIEEGLLERALDTLEASLRQFNRKKR